MKAAEIATPCWVNLENPEPFTRGPHGTQPPTSGGTASERHLLRSRGVPRWFRRDLSVAGPFVGWCLTIRASLCEMCVL